MNSRDRNHLIAFYFSIAFAITTLLYAQKTNVAVLQFDAANITNAEAKVLTDRLRTELYKIGTFNVIERSVMEDILNEQGFQQTGCTSDECVVEVGKLVGVEQMVTGTIGKIGSIYTISARIVDVETGKMVSQSTLDVFGTIETVLTESMSKVAADLSGIVVTEPSRKPSAFGAVEFSSEEKGVNILIDDEVRGTTPLVISDLMPGQYSYVATKPGFRDYSGEYTVEAGKRTDVSIKLKPKVGKISIIADRPWQKFDLYFGDEYYKGINEKNISLPDGNYEFTIKEYGYHDLIKTISIANGQTIVERAKNVPIMVLVNLSLNPLSSIVKLNGKVIDILANDLKMPFGTHKATAKAPKYSKESISFIINDTRAIDLDFHLKPKSKLTTRLLSTVIPGSGQLYCDNRKRGLVYTLAWAGLVAVLNGAYTNYQDEHSLMKDYRRDYQNATNSTDITATWRIYQNQVNTVNDIQTQLLIYGTALGANWIANVIDAWFFNGIPDE